MAGISLYDHQLDAVNRMKNGCILCGGVGSGKSRAAIAYYYREYGGILGTENYVDMEEPRDLYIITTAQKRDKKEWEVDLAPFLLSTYPEANYYKNKVVVDSWNNIKKYQNVYGAFFIFDEQRVVGSGAWVKAFYNIVRKNKWILLSATPGDCWMDYVPVFIANGFYKNKTEFINEHVVRNPYVKYFNVQRYIGLKRLTRQRDSLLVDMDFIRPTTRHHEDVYVRYDISLYKDTMKNRWDPFEDKPIENASRLCYILRKIVNSDDSRIVALMEIIEKTPRTIIFYNFDYELEILRNVLGTYEDIKIAEWNGHNHESIPDSKKWAYLVQYTAGAEGWNCIKTNTIIFYSQNYSYKIMEQASGRIDRLNTKYVDLYYYHLKTRSGIDLAISRALHEKKKFNAERFVKW